MIRFRRLTATPALAGVVAALAVAASGAGMQAERADLPAKLSDQDFWALSEQLSEPNGNFQSDNLVSNEPNFQRVVGDLSARLGEGGVYLGVGPEQNFTYIAALKPRIAFILDVRRGNRDLHLMYKAIFELSADRAEFVSLLFSRPKPAWLGKDASAQELFAAMEAGVPDEEQYQKNLARIWEVLLKRHALPLTPEELDGIKFVYSNFFRFGPGIGYSSSRSGRANPGGVTYSSLMRATDSAGVARSYLASEENFNVLKRLEAANLLVPVVGNFSGPKALRAIGTWLKDRNANVSAYYLSNVEEYLGRDGSWLTFCGNATTLPLDERSSFIRTGTGYRAPGAPQAALTPPAPIPPQQVQTLVAQGGGTMTLPDGRIITVRTAAANGGNFSVVSSGTSGMGSSRLGLMREDLAPCAPPKLVQ